MESGLSNHHRDNRKMWSSRGLGIRNGGSTQTEGMANSPQKLLFGKKELHNPQNRGFRKASGGGKKRPDHDKRPPLFCGLVGGDVAGGGASDFRSNYKEL